MMLPVFITFILSDDERNLLEILFEQYEGSVYHLSLQILRNQADAEDNTIQVFINLSKMLHRIEPDIASKRNKAFIYTVTKYDALDLYRKRRSHIDKTRMIQAEPYINDIPLDDFHYNSLVADMKIVSEQDTDLLILKYVIGLKSREIAGITGLSTGSVELRLHRAKKRMKESDAIRAYGEAENHESL